MNIKKALKHPNMWCKKMLRENTSVSITGGGSISTLVGTATAAGSSGISTGPTGAGKAGSLA